MDQTAKYLIHGRLTIEGVVERSDVVGAIYGQTEGLLGDDLDLRGLQQSSKIGRLDVSVDSANGRSTGTLTIASGLDKVETAVLAAALETIQRVGPCEATVRIASIEDVRAAKRRTVIDRAAELLTSAFEDDLVDSAELVDAVRERTRVERITEYEGLPAGPRVGTADAIIVVEGRADVLTLLSYGINNAIAVEGTNVPDAVAELTETRTVTAFVDGDRGGELVLRELEQVGDVDHVAFAPEGRSVEDLDRHEIRTALREKVPVGVARSEPDEPSTLEGRRPAQIDVVEDRASGMDGRRSADPDGSGGSAPIADGIDLLDSGSPPEPAATTDDAPTTLPGHVESVSGSGRVRALDDGFELLAEAPVEDAFAVVRDTDPVPTVVILDGPLDQRVLDVAAQRGVGQIVAQSEGEFTKKPVGVRIRLVESIGQDGSSA